MLYWLKFHYHKAFYAHFTYYMMCSKCIDWKWRYVAIVLMVFVIGLFELYEQYWTKVPKLFGKTSRCYMGTLNCFREIFRVFSAPSLFHLLWRDDYIKLCSFYKLSSCYFSKSNLETAKGWWASSVIFQYSCWLCLNHCSWCRK